MKGNKKIIFSLMLAVPMFFTDAIAEDAKVFDIIIKNHRFEPDTLNVPANQKFKLKVKNTDNSAEEFESYDFKREKVIAGGKEAVISVGPLEPGEYKFFGEFNPKTAQGKLIAK